MRESCLHFTLVVVTCKLFLKGVGRQGSLQNKKGRNDEDRWQVNKEGWVGGGGGITKMGRNELKVV